MQPRKNSLIHRKLTFVIVLTSFVGLSLACLSFDIYERISYRSAMTDELSALAETLGANTAASLTFNDRKSATELLRGLKAEGQIVAAFLYDEHGAVFATYQRDGTENSPAALGQHRDGAEFGEDSVTLYRSIILGGEKIGTVALTSDLSLLQAKIRHYTEISVAVILLSALVSYLLASRLLRLIIEPVLQLAHIAARVTAQEDYSLRAVARDQDEVGQLVGSFNEMLERIQQRDAALQSARDELELRVTARTSELQLEINERRRAEEQLQLSLKDLKDLSFALDEHCIVARTDQRGMITTVNEKFCSLAKYSKEQLIGKDHRIINSKHHPKEFIRNLWQTISRGRVWKGEIKNRAQDGEEYWVDTTIVPFSGADGKPTQYIAIRSDITALKRIQEDLLGAKEAAEAASRAKSEFLANMSHEIRTPLNGVIGMTELALDTELSAEQREYLETVKMSGDSLLTVINDILDFSKIEAGKIDLEAADFDLRESLELTLKTMAIRADEKGLELLCEVAPEVPQMVQGDAARLRQIVINLVGNSIKFTNEGEVVVKVAVERSEDSGDLFHFIVADTGIGIAEDKRELIFKPFSQADTSTTRKFGGTGLGLTISTRLVEMMGGKIWVESEVGHGSEFHFTARLGAAEAGQSKLASDAQPEVLRDVRVLVVDDNHTNCRILEEMLSRWQMRPTSVNSGTAALAELLAAKDAGAPYGLIISDMHMPEMDGFAMIEKIRGNPQLLAVTIMMLTSAGHRRDAARCRELGVAAYLLKPIRQSDLRDTIARALGPREQQLVVPSILKAAAQELRQPVSALRVLLAEDNLVNQRLAVRLLEKRGHTVVVADTGWQALKALERESFDLVLMDVQMPEMDGMEATAILREKEKESGSHQQVIALTAHAMSGDREKYLAGGMDGYLSKPIRTQELDAILQNHFKLQETDDKLEPTRSK